MKSMTRIAAAALAIFALSSGPQAWQKRPVTIDDSVHLKGVGAPQISPDGSRVLFTVRGWEWPGGKVEPDKGTKPPEARSHIWVVPVVGRRTGASDHVRREGGVVAGVVAGRPLHQLHHHARAPARRPRRGDADGPKEQIWLMRADGGEAWPLTDAKEAVTSYEWAPDSKQIAYLMREPLSKEEDEARRRKDDERVAEANTQMPHLWVVDVESKAADQHHERRRLRRPQLHLVGRQHRIAAGVAPDDDDPRRAAGYPDHHHRHEAARADRGDAGDREQSALVA